MVEEVLGWGEIAKGLVRPCVIEAMGEGVDTELEGFEAGREVFDAVELVSPRALGAFDVAVELGPLRRQDEEAQVALSACVLELGPELRPAIDLDALDAEGDLGDELVEEGCGAAAGWGRATGGAAAQRAVAAGDEGDGPLRHRVVSREVLDGLVGSDVDEEGVDLDEFARPDRLHALGQALGVALAHDAQAAWTGFATKHRHGRDDASRHELRQDAPDHRDRDVDPLPAQEDGELALAPHRMISAQPLDLAHESAGPSRLTLPVWPSRARLQPLLPTVERGPARPGGGGRLVGREPARAGAPPAFERVSPDGCEL